MTGRKIYYITDDKLKLLLEINMRGVPSSCMCNRHVKKRERKTTYQVMTKIYCWSMSQYSPKGDFHELNLSNKKSLLKSFLRTPDNDEHGLLIECDLDYPSSIREKTNFFPVSLEKKDIKVEDFSTYRLKNKPEKINLQKN